jgi:hypothetical protein
MVLPLVRANGSRTSSKNPMTKSVTLDSRLFPDLCLPKQRAFSKQQQCITCQSNVQQPFVGGDAPGQ